MPPQSKESKSSKFTIDFWDTEREHVDLTCLLPNGIYLPLPMKTSATIKEIKAEIIRQSRKYPLHDQLKDPVDYELSGIATYSDIETFEDESKRLYELRPVFCLLCVVERTPEKAQTRSRDYAISSLVSSMIKKSHQEYSTPCNPEIEDFRLKMKDICEELELERMKFDWHDKLLYEHPLRVTHTNTLKWPSKVLIAVFLEDETSFTFPISLNTKPMDLIQMALDKVHRSHITMPVQAKHYILKVRGRQEYLYGDKYHVAQYVYIQESCAAGDVPHVVLKPIHKLPAYLNFKNERQKAAKNQPPKRDDYLRSRVASLSQPEFVLSWQINKPFGLQLHSIENVNYDSARAIKVGIKMALYHGEKQLCSFQSLDVDNVNPNNKQDKFNFQDKVFFDISLDSLPRMTRLCIVIFEVTKASRSKKSSNTKDKDIYKDSNVNGNVNPLAWVNTTVFDYRSRLRNDQLGLRAWTYADDLQSDDIFHPLGTIESNPCKDKCATTVELTFLDFGHQNIQYPSEEHVLSYAMSLANKETDEIKIDINLFEILKQYATRDQYEIPDKVRAQMWQLRNEIRRYAPEEVALLLHCVNWNNRDEVATMWSLLMDWPPISVERALELLDYAYPDPAVRSFAIRCLRTLHKENVFRDDELLLYLLQLVQAIKHESYLDCDLVNFILERAWRNQRIGHYFFWHLRSEMQTPGVQTRFSLLLEAYLKGSEAHVDTLTKQLVLLNKLKDCSEKAKKGSKEKVRAGLQQTLTKEKKSLMGIESPLDPSFRCKAVIPERCKVMDSKMRPLWIVFENEDHNSKDIYMIFKNGDDLRQDMLTLQMLRVMDQLWKKEGLDFHMNIYNCISMEQRLGMIEVVLDAETIANIQKEKGMFSATSPFKKGSIYSWLKEQNKNSEENFKKAVEEFTLSCAGYCVATYVLGVADRHSDNIMVKRNGQLFHIDYGHILGHFKEKFGVRRERVPFVLTHDFVYVINNGRSDRESKEFTKFKKHCEQAFMVLRKHGGLILSLFSMMISTGLPELSSEKDLNYLKETLVLSYTDEKALEHFQLKFSEALANSWKTSLNWASHNFSKNNKQ